MGPPVPDELLVPDELPALDELPPLVESAVPDELAVLDGLPEPELHAMNAMSAPVVAKAADVTFIERVLPKRERRSLLMIIAQPARLLADSSNYLPYPAATIFA